MKRSPPLALTRSNALIATIAAMLIAALWALPGCGGSSPQGTGAAGNSAGAGHGGSTAAGTGGNGTAGFTGTGGGTGAGGTGGVGVKVGTAQCSDGIDNDGDGKIDSADPECVG